MYNLYQTCIYVVSNLYLCIRICSSSHTTHGLRLSIFRWAPNLRNWSSSNIHFPILGFMSYFAAATKQDEGKKVVKYSSLDWKGYNKNEKNWLKLLWNTHETNNVRIRAIRKKKTLMKILCPQMLYIVGIIQLDYESRLVRLSCIILYEVVSWELQIHPYLYPLVPRYIHREPR